MKHMKKAILLLVVAGFGLAQAGCYGSFTMTKKLHTWNGGVGDKFVNALVFVGLNIVPVYELAILADGLVLNTLEFWTGDNPMAMKAGEEDSKLLATGDKVYQVTAKNNRFEAVQLEGPNKGEKVVFQFDETQQQWKLIAGNESHLLLEIISESDVQAEKQNMVKVFQPDGSYEVHDFNELMATSR